MKRRDFIKNCTLATGALLAPLAVASPRQEGISFLDYVRHMEPNLVEGWHHKAISDAVAQHKKLVVCGPPTMGKSMLFSNYLLAWAMGLQPDTDAIAVSSHGNVARLRQREFRETIASRRHMEIFPGEITGHVQFLGVGESVGGRRADLMVFDDAVIGWPELSHTDYNRRVTWIDHATCRLVPSGSLYFVGTRISDDDLYAGLMRRDDFEYLKIPAASNKGRIWPYLSGTDWPRQLPYDKLMTQYYQTP